MLKETSMFSKSIQMMLRFFAPDLIVFVPDTTSCKAAITLLGGLELPNSRVPNTGFSSNLSLGNEATFSLPQDQCLIKVTSEEPHLSRRQSHPLEKRECVLPVTTEEG